MQRRIGSKNMQHFSNVTYESCGSFKKGIFFLDKQHVQDIAIAEIMTPTLALTQQFLAVNTIVFHNHTPLIEDILLREEEKKAEVYFPIEGENYYFVVYVDLENPYLIAVAMSAGCD